MIGVENSFRVEHGAAWLGSTWSPMLPYTTFAAS